ncbi:SGNH/GDSL hydrolase family protein [Sphingomonas sp. MMS24-J13]|uniref:SGNH/GDSL hydrolase family protein n=1 Tax=Sphingomonas sp. MMS24-J13 TaxID=3238686 RepID=UPI00384F08F8
MIALALAGALLGGGCDGALCNGHALAPVFAKLARQGVGVGGRPVHILQIGDSHTAGDAITNGWRTILQARYGYGGRGVLPPGRPYDGYTTHGVTVSMSPGWKIAADFGSAWSSPSPPLGLSAFSLTSQSDGASMSLIADPSEMFDRLTVCAIAQPGAGRLALSAGTENVTFNLSSPTPRPECRTVKLAQPTSAATVAASDGPVTVTSWGTFRDSGGVVVSNLGVVGSQLLHFQRTDDAVLAEELNAYRPDLIVVAFGTNEGFGPHFSKFEYEIILRTEIGRLRRLAGNVPILLLGAPDALSRRAEMRNNADSGPSEPCGPTPAQLPAPATAASTPPAAPATQSPQGVIASIMDHLRDSLGMAPDAAAAPPPVVVATPTPPSTRGPLFPPPALKAVREVQRSVASSLNVAFWDWEARMGGRCTADAWFHSNPPLMRSDYVHYTSAGGAEIAKRLQADLDRAAAK